MDNSVSYSTTNNAIQLPKVLHGATELPLHRLHRRPTQSMVRLFIFLMRLIALAQASFSGFLTILDPRGSTVQTSNWES